MKEKHYAVTKDNKLVKIDPLGEIDDDENITGYRRYECIAYLKRKVVAYTITVTKWKKNGQ